MNDDDRCRSRLDPTVEGGARHGIAAPRGLSAPPSAKGGRFARMFPHLPPCDPGPEAIEALVAHLSAVEQPSPENTRIPAGYTYLAQFVDHDITFDPTSKLERDNDPHALVNFRTPRFDLDSLYGSGPADQPFLYDWTGQPRAGVKLLVGHNPAGGCLSPLDLPRNAQERAIIADARNDENLIVSQLHLLFIQFHNKVVDCVCAKQPTLPGMALFDEARRIVRWHYQWIVTHDLLRKIVDKDVARSVLPRLVERPGVTEAVADLAIYRWKHDPVMPVEFSAAAFRFGHSMVRSDYPLPCEPLTVPILPAPGREDDPHLGGFRALPDSLRIDWTRFFGLGQTDVRSLKIDHRLSGPLFRLPPDGASLPRLNLLRGRALGLPSGSDVARAMGQPKMPDEQLLPHDFWPVDDQPELRKAVLAAPPLWFYILREPDREGIRGVRLGPVGGRIVAEVLVGLLVGDRQSYVHQHPTWTPELEGATPGDFTMADLVTFTLPPHEDHAHA